MASHCNEVARRLANRLQSRHWGPAQPVKQSRIVPLRIAERCRAHNEDASEQQDIGNPVAVY
jgi:hypothetical protein